MSCLLGRCTAWLDPRNAARLPRLLLGLLLAAGRRTATAWFRAAGITDDFRRAYHTINAVGRRADDLALNDTPTARYGPCVEGAGIHHNPSPGPAGEPYEYGLKPKYPVKAKAPSAVAYEYYTPANRAASKPVELTVVDKK